MMGDKEQCWPQWHFARRLQLPHVLKLLPCLSKSPSPKTPTGSFGRYQRASSESWKRRSSRGSSTSRRRPRKRSRNYAPTFLAPFELRAGDLRVLYNVEGDEVVLLIVGRKVGNKLIVEGEEFHGHQDHPVEPPGNGSPADAE